MAELSTGIASSQPSSVTRFGKLEIPDREAVRLTDAQLAARLVEMGATRLTAERFVAIERGKDTPGRARRRGYQRG